MYLLDFIYDDVQLSSLDCMVGYITTGNETSISMGSVLTLNTIKNNATNKFGLSSSVYEEPIQVSFDIFKNTCSDSEDYAFDENEISKIMRWLNQKTYKKFKPIYDDESMSYLYYMGTFTSVTAINVGGKTYGFSLTFQTNSPFGYYDDITVAKEITTVDTDSLTIDCDSDEIGYLYPSSFTVYVTSDGDLTITNSADTIRTVVANCVSGETLTFDCENKIITSSKAHSTLYNDFNYNFPRFVITSTSAENTLTFSLPCTVTVTYAPIRKVGIFA